METENDDTSEKCKGACGECGERCVFRQFNKVDGQWLEDGCFCENCHEYVDDPDY